MGGLGFKGSWDLVTRVFRAIILITPIRVLITFLLSPMTLQVGLGQYGFEGLRKCSAGSYLLV